MNIFTLKTGDLIVRQKGPFSTHFLVYLGIQNGVAMVAENQIGIGVRITTLAKALAGNAIKRFENFGGTESQRSLVIPRINGMLGHAYDLIAFNCEHFARWIANGKVESKQVKVASTVIIATSLALLSSKNTTAQTIGVLGLIAGFIGHASQRQ